jgi:hypothetical protein
MDSGLKERRSGLVGAIIEACTYLGIWRLAMEKFILLGIFLAGCQQNGATFEHRGTLDVQARGLALYEDGESGNAGMWGTTCDFETRSGETTNDWDYPGEQDQVLDASSTSIGTYAVLVTTPGGLFITRPYDWPEQVRIKFPGVIDGRFVEGGIAVLRDPAKADCMVSWRNDLEAGTINVDVPAELCDAPNVSLDVDVASGVVVVGAGDLGAVVSQDDALLVDGLGDLVAWDPYTDTIYTAYKGSDLVSGFKMDGTVVWSTAVAGAVLSLDSMGPAESALVMLENPDGTGDLVVIDGYTGIVETSVPTPSAAQAIDVSDNGAVVALILPDTTHFYDVNSLD